MSEAKSPGKSTQAAGTSARDKMETHRSSQSSRSSKSSDDFSCPVLHPFALPFPFFFYHRSPLPIYLHDTPLQPFSFLLKICHYIAKGFWKREDSAASFTAMNHPVRTPHIAALQRCHYSLAIFPYVNPFHPVGIACLRRAAAG